MKTRFTLILVVTIALLTSASFADSFWNFSIGKTTYGGGDQLVFSNVQSDVQWAVGGYKYTQVNSTWYGPYPAASPGANYPIHRKFDSMALFFKPTEDAARFLLFTGMPETGTTASEVGYGNRVFGPGDLKIDNAGNTYGVGLRLDDLLWAVNENETNAYFKVYKATGGVDSIHAGDVGTRGIVELNPNWDHLDHYGMAAYDPAGYAFYVAGSGTECGTNTVAFADTGVSLSGYQVYSYDIAVPWSAIGVNPGNYNFTASWRPTCGNDMIAADFSGSRRVPPPAVPEWSSIMLAASGLFGMVASRRRSTK